MPVQMISFSIVLFTIAAGCGGTPAFEPRLTVVQQEVFTKSCIGCHANAAAPRGLDLQEGRSYTLLVNVLSPAAKTRRVTPGDAAASLLYNVLRGPASATPQMPMGSAALDEERQDLIKRWINAGAPND